MKTLFHGISSFKVLKDILRRTFRVILSIIFISSVFDVYFNFRNMQSPIPFRKLTFTSTYLCMYKCYIKIAERTNNVLIS